MTGDGRRTKPRLLFPGGRRVCASAIAAIIRASGDEKHLRPHFSNSEIITTRPARDEINRDGREAATASTRSATSTPDLSVYKHYYLLRKYIALTRAFFVFVLNFVPLAAEKIP